MSVSAVPSTAMGSNAMILSRRTPSRRGAPLAPLTATRTRHRALRAEPGGSPLRSVAREDGRTDHIIKVCGVTSAEDARLAASEGADLIGMILWPKAGRSVSLEKAQLIAEESRRYGSEAVGVFVDEDADTIARVCDRVGISYAQLHGDQARASFGSLPEHLGVVYVVHADSNGVIHTPLPQKGIHGDRRPDWFLVDSMKGGSGEKFDWEAVRPPTGSRHGWLLAGGLTDENVAAAIEATGCNGVDVSSGVCDETKLKKDPRKVTAYIRGARKAFGMDL